MAGGFKFQQEHCLAALARVKYYDARVANLNWLGGGGVGVTSDYYDGILQYEIAGGNSFGRYTRG